MDRNAITPGKRVEIAQVGEGTVVGWTGENEVEVAVSEVETYWVTAEEVNELT
jgi:hypothetical protein